MSEPSCECKKLIEAEARVENERWRSHKILHGVIEADINRRLEKIELGKYVTIDSFETKHEALRTRMDEISRFIWIGVGIAIAISYAIDLITRSFGR